MNRERRKTLKGILNELDALEALRQEIMERLQEVIDEEQEALDNMPESLQYSERGEQMQEYIDAMESALNELDYMDIESTVDQLMEIVEG